MDITDAHHLARQLMNDHGLNHVPFEFDRGKRRIGCTHFQYDKVLKITLSRHFVVLLPEAEIRDVILHEIAHAIAGKLAGHGAAWRNVARQIGAKPTRCTVASARPEASLEGICPNGHKTTAHRLPLRVKSCPKCCPVFNTKYAFVWHRHGKVVPFAQMPARYKAEAMRQQTRAAAPVDFNLAIK